MKIDSKKFANFIKKVCLNGAIKNCVMRFEADGLHITVKEGKDACACVGVLNSEAFSEYAPMTDCAVLIVPLLLNLLKDMTGTVDISVVKNKFCFSSDDMSFELTMPDLKYVTSNFNDSNIPVLKDDGGFNLEVRKLLKLKKAFDHLKVPFVEVKTESGNLTLTTGENKVNQVTINEKVDYKDVSCMFGNILMVIVGVLEGKVNIMFDNNHLMLITERGEQYSVKWLIAPMVAL